VVSASVGGFLGLCLLLPGSSSKRGGVVQAGAAAAGWCMLNCGRSPCFPHERVLSRWGGGSALHGAIGVVWRCSAASNHFSVQKEIGVVSGIVQRDWRHTRWSGVSFSHPPPSVCRSFLFLCRFRGLLNLLGLYLLLWAGLCVHKGEVGGIMRGIAGAVGSESEKEMVVGEKKRV